jgi:hypothetical protein
MLHILHSNGIQNTTITSEDENFAKDVCEPNEKYAIVTHGWKESCNTEWIVKLIANLEIFRGGCIICMDYSRFATIRQYGGLVKGFPYVVRRLREKLLLLQTEGFSPDNGYFFGFDFGAQVGEFFHHHSQKECNCNIDILNRNTRYTDNVWTP